jgi:hypothetical protein
VRGQLTDNNKYVWFYFLADVIPILTRMSFFNFQATLPLPRLLCEKAEGAKGELRFKVLKWIPTPASGLLPNLFFNGYQTGEQVHSENGGVLNNTAITEMKEKILLCVYFMQEKLNRAIFGDQFMRVWAFAHFRPLGLGKGQSWEISPMANA